MRRVVEFAQCMVVQDGEVGERAGRLESVTLTPSAASGEGTEATLLL